MPTRSLNTEDAYQYCEALTKKRESNFSLGFQFLPAHKKRAIHVVYAFCRYVDDISDEEKSGDIPRLLEKWKAELSRIYRGGEISHPISVALKDVLKTYPIPANGFLDLINGCVEDQRKTSYESFEELTGYCELVATSIAKVSLPVYGCLDMIAAFPLARDLSFAFQLTNVLRDVAEDLERGRVYVPQEDLRRFDLKPQNFKTRAPDAAIRRFFEYEGQRCEGYFQRGLEVLRYLSSDSHLCVYVMGVTYHTLLEKVLRDPLRALTMQTVLTQAEKEKVIETARRELRQTTAPK